MLLASCAGNAQFGCARCCFLRHIFTLYKYRSMWCGSIFILCSSEGIRQVFGIFYKNAYSCHFMCRVQNWPFSALRLERFWQLLKHAENWQLDWFDPSCLLSFLALNKESQKQSASTAPTTIFFFMLDFSPLFKSKTSLCQMAALCRNALSILAFGKFPHPTP